MERLKPEFESVRRELTRLERESAGKWPRRAAGYGSRVMLEPSRRLLQRLHHIDWLGITLISSRFRELPRLAR